jgi:MraZ protein
MYIGKFYHSLDNKGRLSLPKKFRLGNKEWIVTRGLDGCLFVLKKDDYINNYEKIINRTFTKKDHRDLGRLLANDATEVKADKNGRINLPSNLIEVAKLNKHVVLVGSFNRIEIWDRDNYHKYMDNIEDEMEDIAERIDVNE